MNPQNAQAQRRIREENTEKLRGWLQAAREGRLMVLPCRMGGKLYRVVTSRRRYVTAVYIQSFYLSPVNAYQVGTDFGRRIFETLEEAIAAKERIEKKLKEQEHAEHSKDH